MVDLGFFYFSLVAQRVEGRGEFENFLFRGWLYHAREARFIRHSRF